MLSAEDVVIAKLTGTRIEFDGPISTRNIIDLVKCGGFKIRDHRTARAHGCDWEVTLLVGIRHSLSLYNVGQTFYTDDIDDVIKNKWEEQNDTNTN